MASNSRAIVLRDEHGQVALPPAACLSPTVLFLQKQVAELRHELKEARTDAYLVDRDGWYRFWCADLSHEGGRYCTECGRAHLRGEKFDIDSY